MSFDAYASLLLQQPRARWPRRLLGFYLNSTGLPLARDVAACRRDEQEKRPCTAVQEYMLRCEAQPVAHAASNASHTGACVQRAGHADLICGIGGL